MARSIRLIVKFIETLLLLLWLGCSIADKRDILRDVKNQLNKYKIKAELLCTQCRTERGLSDIVFE